MARKKLKSVQKLVAQLVVNVTNKEELGATWVGTIPDNLAPVIYESIEHLRGVAEEQDFSSSVYQLCFKDRDLYVIMVVPDGNDGWFEAYMADGELVGAGQYIGSKVAWADVAEVRACVAATSIPENILPELRTLLVWELQPDGSYRSNCGRFTIRQSGTIWGVVELPGDCQTLQEAKDLAQMVAPYYSE